MLAGAASVEAADIDAFACAACRLNAATNGVEIAVTGDDIVGSENSGWDVVLAGDVCRSEEHTSELQSLMRISYAVFCLKKKKSQNIYRHETANIRLNTIKHMKLTLIILQ